MKRTPIISLIVLFLLSPAHSELLYCSASSPNDESSKLYSVRRIFIEEISNIKAVSKVEPFLKRELQRSGFIIVEDRREADAILTGQIKVELVLHGDGSVPEKAIYEYELRLTNDVMVWKGEVKFPARRNLAEENEYAAQKIAEKISRDWKKSAKRGSRK